MVEVIPQHVAERAATRYTVAPNGCHITTKTLRADGYAEYSWRVGGRGGRLFRTTAHRAAYQYHHGPVPDGLQVDHLCHDPADCAGGPTCQHRGCVRAHHLRPATPRENTLRSGAPAASNLAKTHCPAGHPYDEANTWRDKRGDRQCRACHAERERARRARQPSRRK